MRRPSLSGYVTSFLVAFLPYGHSLNAQLLPITEVVISRSKEKETIKQFDVVKDGGAQPGSNANFEDNSKAFQKTIQMALNANEKEVVVFVPQGTYGLSRPFPTCECTKNKPKNCICDKGASKGRLDDNLGTISILNEDPKKHIVFRGEGSAHSILSFKTDKRDGLVIDQRSWNVRIENLCIRDVIAQNVKHDSKDIEYEAYGIRVRFGCENVAIGGCLFENCDDAAIKTQSAPDVGGNKYRVKNCLITNNVIRNVPEGCGIELARCEGTVVDNNLIEDVSQWGIRPLGCVGARLSGNTIRNCRIGVDSQLFKYDQENKSPLIEATSNLTIEDNHILDCPVCGIRLDNGSTNISVFRNVIYGRAGFGVKLVFYAEFSGFKQLEFIKNVVVARNSLVGLDRSIDARGNIDGLKIDANSLYKFSEFGVHITNNIGDGSTIKDVEISNNRLITDSGAKPAIAIFDITEAKTNVTKVSVSDNLCRMPRPSKRQINVQAKAEQKGNVTIQTRPLGPKG